MSSIQKFLKGILPGKWAANMEAKSRQWIIHCNHCGHERSVWDAGGIRWKAASMNKQVMVVCPGCDQLKSARVFKRETSQPAKTE